MFRKSWVYVILYFLINLPKIYRLFVVDGLCDLPDFAIVQVSADIQINFKLGMDKIGLVLRYFSGRFF